MSPAGRAFDNIGLLGYRAEVDAELPAEAYPEAMLTPRVQYTAELVANDLAGIPDRVLTSS